MSELIFVDQKSGEEQGEVNTSAFSLRSCVFTFGHFSGGAVGYMELGAEYSLSYVLI